jgi:hypothetical protein
MLSAKHEPMSNSLLLCDISIVPAGNSMGVVKIICFYFICKIKQLHQ